MFAMLNLAALTDEDRGMIRRNWGWFVALGLFLIAGGLAGLVFVGMLTLVAVLFVGWSFVFAGVLEVVHAIMRRGWSGFWLDLISGIITAVAGFLIVFHPLTGASVLTIFLGVLFLVGGLFRIVAGVAIRNPYAGWLALQGLVSVLLGVFILADWPVSTVWVLGTLVGIDLVVNGARLMSLGFAARSLSAPADADRTPPPAPAV